MKRSKHRLSHHRLASFDMGQLVPVGCVEVLPGDTFRHSSSVLLRVGALVTPVMHPVTVRLHHWYVPTRLAYNSWHEDDPQAWDRFINGTETGDTLGELSLLTADITAGTLANHLGLPVGTTDVTVNLAPFVAYQMIWQQFYRDPELHTFDQSLNDKSSVTPLRNICWEKDYFTSARPNAQYGATAISIPFQSGLQAPVKGIYASGSLSTIQEGTVSGRGTISAHDQTIPFSHWLDEAGGAALELSSGTEASARPKVYADLANAEGGGIAINDLRRSLALQRFLENRSRFGDRYRDYLRYLGVRPSDGRIEEPEYLGGGKQTVAFSEVLATAEGTNTEVGDMAGHGIAALRTRPYTRFFEEHGFVLSLISVRPKSMYMNAVNRHWLKNTKDDLWQKEYETMGPQSVAVKEVYGSHTNTTDVFGYTDRFREYREHPSYVSGLFNTTDDSWHMAREFGAAPALNSTFVECVPTDRVYADANDPELRCMVNHSLIARRLVSKQAKLS